MYPNIATYACSTFLRCNISTVCVCQNGRAQKASCCNAEEEASFVKQVLKSDFAHEHLNEQLLYAKLWTQTLTNFFIPTTANTHAQTYISFVFTTREQTTGVCNYTDLKTCTLIHLYHKHTHTRLSTAPYAQTHTSAAHISQKRLL